MSYGSSPTSKQSMYCLRRSRFLRSTGRNELEVVCLARLDPDGIGERRRAGHLRAQVGRYLAQLLPVAGGDADEARLERVVLVLLAPVAQVVEELADLGRGELGVRDPADGGHHLGAQRRTAGRHHHVLVPAEQGRRLHEIGDLGEAPPQLVERGLTHDEKPISSGALGVDGRRRGGNVAGRRGSSEDDLPLRMNRARFR